ncbi:major facilitator superfamily domain-containing protein [Zopfochytrium polystomum]|nr:major facilitator superfamily domain-containing protein [Zopfochytrium polystomum]
MSDAGAADFKQVIRRLDRPRGKPGRRGKFLRKHNLSTEYVQQLISDSDGVRRVLRRVDLTVLPLLCVTYMLQFVDKQALSYSAVFDLFTDAHINGAQYSWFPSIVYIAYFLAEYPWSFLAQTTNIAKVTGVCIVLWGSVLMLTAASHDFSGMAFCRFFLGVFEAPITTFFVMTVAMWYTREEQPFRAGIFTSCNGVGSILGGLLTYGIGHMGGSLPVWKSIYLMLGAVTVLWGFVILLLLPDSIIAARRFTIDEKVTLIGRTRLGRTGVLSHRIRPHQIWEALLDPQIHLLFLFMLLNATINGGIANFGSLIIKGVVSDQLKTVLLGMPVGAVQIFWILSGSYAAYRFKNVNTIVMPLYLIPTAVGVLAMWLVDRKSHSVGVLFGYYVCTGYVTSLVLALQMPAANLGGYTKRMTGTAAVFLAVCVGNIVGPHAFLAEEAPTYPTGCKVILGCCVGQVVLAMLLRWLLSWRNQQRDAKEKEGKSQGYLDDTRVEGVDLTDFENPNFRYVL